MSTSDNENGTSPEPGEAEYLKPEAGARDGRPQNRGKEAPVLDGVAEEVADEERSAKGDDSAKTAAAAQPRAGSGILVAGAAGLGGAAIAIAALFAAGGISFGDRDDPRVAALNERIAALEEASSQAGRDVNAGLASLASRLDTLEGNLTTLSEAPESAAAMNERIGAVGG